MCGGMLFLNSLACPPFFLCSIPPPQRRLSIEKCRKRSDMEEDCLVAGLDKMLLLSADSL